MEKSPKHFYVRSSAALLSALLVVTLVFGMLPTWAFAYADNESIECTASVQPAAPQSAESKTALSVSGKRNIAKAKVRAIAPKPYTGKLIKPKPRVVWGNTRLKLGRDYTLSWSKNRKVGIATVIIRGKGAYRGVKKVRFAIRRNIAKAKIGGVKKAYTFTGSALKPKVKVKYGSKVLKRGKHYTVTYKRNKKAGTATIIIKGKGAYAGTKKKTFRIYKRSVSKARVVGFKKKGYLYTGKPLKPRPTVMVKVGKKYKKLKYGRDYTLRYGLNIMPGTARVVIVGKGNYKGKRTVNFKIVRGQYYQLKRDTWKFDNISEAIPYSVYKRVFGSAKARLVQWRDTGEDGTCYGMCASIGSIARYKAPKVQSYRKGSKKAYTLRQVGQSWKSSQNKLAAKHFIQACHIMQFDYNIAQAERGTINDPDALVRAAKRSTRGGTPIVIGIYGYDYWGSKVGHAIFPLAVKESASATTIQVYDPNYPNATKKFVLYKRGGDYTSFSYVPGGSTSWTRGFSYSAPCGKTKGLLRGQGVYKSSHIASTEASPVLVAVSSDMKVVEAGGKSYHLSPNALNDPNKVLHVQGTGTNQSGNELYYVNFDSSKMGFAAIKENTTVSAAADTSGVDVSAAAGSEVALDVSDSAENTVVVDAESGSDFQITFFDENKSGNLDEVVVEGTAGGTVVGQQDGSALTVSGMETISVACGNESTGEVELDPHKVYRVELADSSSSEDESSKVESGVGGMQKSSLEEITIVESGAAEGTVVAKAEELLETVFG